MATTAPATEVAGPAPLDFPAFYAEHHRRTLALAIALTGSASAAEELVQDAFLDAHRRWAKVSAYERPDAWIRRAVLNRAVSGRRRRMTAQRSAGRLTIVTDSGLDARDDELWRHVRALPERQAQLVALVYVEGMTITDAAAVLAIAPTTAATHLHRAKQRLQRELSPWKDDA